MQRDRAQGLWFQPGSAESIWRWLVRGIAVLFAMLAICFQPAIALAQSAEGTEADNGEEPNEAVEPAPPNFDISTIPTEKVSQFVRAYLQVLDLIENREGELKAAETEAEVIRLRQDIQTEAFALIEAAGLTQPEYLQLLGLANTDPELGERIANQLQEAEDS